MELNEEPQCKRQKMSLNKTLMDMMNSKNNLKTILGDNLLEECTTCRFYTGKIKDKKLIYRVIVELNRIMPLDEHPHLKRAKGVDILLCPVDDITIDQLKEKLTENKFDFDTLLNSDIHIGCIPKNPPLVKWQFDLANKMWPCNFHPNKNFERMVSGSYFNDDELIIHRKYMAIAHEIGLIPIKDNIESLLGDIKGSIIVDPEIDSIVAIGYDKSDENPCKHHVMVAIDNVAKSQNGGAWDADTNDSDNTRKGTPEDVMQILIEKFGKGIKFGARPTIRRGESHQADTEPSGPYLCTNYNVYTTLEPCLMCAMALVHSRAKKVFFGMPNVTKGALGSKCKLHTATGLNHHYEVFTGFFDN